MTAPTARQLQVLLFILRRHEDWLPAPSVREVAAHLGIASVNGASDHLKALIRKGLLERVAPLMSRGLRVTEAGHRACSAARIFSPAALQGAP